MAKCAGVCVKSTVFTHIIPALFAVEVTEGN